MYLEKWLCTWQVSWKIADYSKTKALWEFCQETVVESMAFVLAESLRSKEVVVSVVLQGSQEIFFFHVRLFLLCLQGKPVFSFPSPLARPSAQSIEIFGFCVQSVHRLLFFETFEWNLCHICSLKKKSMRIFVAKKVFNWWKNWRNLSSLHWKHRFGQSCKLLSPTTNTRTPLNEDGESERRRQRGRLQGGGGDFPPRGLHKRRYRRRHRHRRQRIFAENSAFR